MIFKHNVFKIRILELCKENWFFHQKKMNKIKFKYWIKNLKAKQSTNIYNAVSFYFLFIYFFSEYLLFSSQYVVPKLCQ